MEYDANSGEGAPAPPHMEQNIYMTGYGSSKWLWIVLAVVVACAAIVTAAFAMGGGEKREPLKGNAGVAALYGFFMDQQDNQDRLMGNMPKEMGKRLFEEPFEIESKLEVNFDDMGETLIPFDSIALGVDVKYDMNDLGVKIGSMGIGALEAYIIGDDIVVSFLGRAGCMPIELKDKDILKESMGLNKRIKALLPFLPEDDGLYLNLLETVSLSVPDSCTETGTEEVYSPKEGKDVRMDAVTTTLDAKAIRKTAKDFGDELKGDRSLGRELKRIIDEFTGFTGMEKTDLDKLLKDVQKSAETAELDDVIIKWTVYSINGIYTGVSFTYAGSDINYSYITISEFSEQESYIRTKTYMNGSGTESELKYIWHDNKVDISGEVNNIISPDTGNTTQLINGTMEFVKEDSNEYLFTAEMSFEGDAYNEMLNSSDSMSFDMDMEAEIAVGPDLGTLKEDRDWDGIYEKKWGSMEDVFGWIFPSDDFFEFDTGSNL